MSERGLKTVRALQQVVGERVVAVTAGDGDEVLMVMASGQAVSVTEGEVLAFHHATRRTRRDDSQLALPGVS